MIRKQSTKLFNKAVKIIPGGVNSPVRACKSVGSNPIFIQKAKGSKLFDVDGNEYVDFVGSWGPMILGHSHPQVIEAIKKALERGTSFGAPTDLENELAEIVIKCVPSLEMIRMVNSGTEATMSAVRLARFWTKKNKILKFNGCYHGHSDSLLSDAGSGIATLQIEETPGVLNSTIENTLSIPYNDSKTLENTLKKNGKDIACIIVEPVAGNMGFVKPKEEFLKNLVVLSKKYKCLLIFDEVMTGFRLGLGGAQGLFKIKPDLSCFGKVIGGGLPVGAYGGRKEIMENIAPSGKVYQAGTLSGNPIAMSAGIATLKVLMKEKNIYKDLDKKTKLLISGIKDMSKKHKVDISADYLVSMFGVFFTKEKVENYETAKKSNTKLFAKFYNEMLNNGIYLAPSQFEAGFMSFAHTNKDIEKTIDAADKAFKKIKHTPSKS